MSEPDELARELDLLRCRAARGTHGVRVGLRDLAARVGIPRSTLHTYVTGRTLPPVEVLDRIVIALGASPAEQAEWADAWFRLVGRRPGSPRPAAGPVSVGTWQINQLCRSAEMFSDWQQLYGGWAMREAMRAELRRVVPLLDVPCPEDLRARLCRGVARFAHATGSSAFDTGDDDEARRCFRLGLSCAEESGDWHLRAFMLASLSRHAAWLGDAGDSLAFADRGLVRADRLTATERAMLCAARARALAALGRDAEAVRAVGEADEQFARSAPADDPPWTAFYDHPQHCGDTGVALLGLAVRGHCVDQAHTRMAASAAGHPDTRRRSRVLAQLQLAALDMAVGDPHDAVATGAEALDAAATIRSGQVLDALRQLDRHAARREHVPVVPAFRQRLATALADHAT